jgi:predicted CXXCH cytochrome family protein
MMNDVFNKNRVHWPLVDKVGCLNCHEPHASEQKKLLTGEMNSLCGKCHPDTMEKQEKLAELERKEKEAKASSKGAAARGKEGAITHNPVQGGECSACHLPHASDSAYLMNKPFFIESCGACHDWSKHATHPMGAKVVDLRNKNITMDCLSCHRSHGTGNRYLIPFPTVTDLCVQCHKQYKR